MFTLHNGDCLEYMKSMQPKSVDCIMTDPPYGINKAEWDKSFDTSWLDLVAPLSDKVAIMPGVWNILDCPKEFGGLVYKWTMAAHLTNGMTRGGLGFGNWIPALIYQRKVYQEDVLKWCSSFADWCKENRISKNDLNLATNTSDMGGWWASKLPHRCQVPTPEQWQKIKIAFNPPSNFDELIAPSDYSPIGDCRDFAIGRDDKPDHPSPKPLNVMMWFIESITKPGDTVFDPFMGSGTTGVACLKLGRNFIGCELKTEYFAIAESRIKSAALQQNLFTPSNTACTGRLDSSANQMSFTAEGNPPAKARGAKRRQ